MKALDLFAGTGWGVACQNLGIEEFGVEIMPEAVLTRDANNMTTVYHDVWDGLQGGIHVDYDILIASPPCQTFSMAGNGKGREALDQVFKAIDDKAYTDANKLHNLGEQTDMRTALVLTPLAHVYRDRPQYVVFEQVPPVLPVWEACAREMQEMGYSTWTGNVNAEQYGVPQTRRRAILIARLDGVEAKAPTPTHSKYYSSTPTKLDEGVRSWVSITEALGVPEKTYLRHGKQKNAAVRSWAEPSATMAFGHDSASFGWVRKGTETPEDFTRITVEEASVLQSYPATFAWRGAKTKQFLQIGNAVPPLLAEVILKEFTKS